MRTFVEHSKYLQIIMIIYVFENIFKMLRTFERFLGNFENLKTFVEYFITLLEHSKHF